jgi:hypothetical protein
MIYTRNPRTEYVCGDCGWRKTVKGKQSADYIKKCPNCKNDDLQVSMIKKVVRK